MQLEPQPELHPVSNLSFKFAEFDLANIDLLFASILSDIINNIKYKSIRPL